MWYTGKNNACFFFSIFGQSLDEWICYSVISKIHQWLAVLLVSFIFHKFKRKFNKWIHRFWANSLIWMWEETAMTVIRMQRSCNRFNTVDVWYWDKLCCSGLPVNVRIFSNIPVDVCQMVTTKVSRVIA